MAGDGYRKLMVWSRSMDLVTEAYSLSGRLPSADRFELASQMRRAALSVPCNIAEGYGRAHRAEYCQFISVANGSSKELETQLEVALRVGHLRPGDADTALALAAEAGKMLRALPSALQNRG